MANDADSRQSCEALPCASAQMDLDMCTLQSQCCVQRHELMRCLERVQDAFA
jgi:hypothetical protein